MSGQVAPAAPETGRSRHMPRPRLELRDLRHAFASTSRARRGAAAGELHVLDGLSFALRPGEIFGLLGPNGSGKSTALRVLTGLLVPDAGEVLLDGERVEPGGRALRRCMGVVFQAPSLDPRLSARENLRLAAALYGLGGSEARERCEAQLEFAGLRERGDDVVSTFSGGMKRRLELARALLHEPSLLVMDEPTTGLDERFFREAWERIEHLRAQRGLSVLLTTHRADEAERCDRVAIVDGGRVIAEGTPEALRAQVAGDVLTIAAHDPEALCRELAAHFDLAPRVADGRVLIERERGHELIPRLVEALPAGRIDSLSMHRPTLSDVFVKLTGRSLRDEAARTAVEA